MATSHAKEETARDGDMVVALSMGGATVKYLFREPNRYRLEPANQTMGPIFSRDVRVLGQVIWVVRRVG